VWSLSETRDRGSHGGGGWVNVAVLEASRAVVLGKLLNFILDVVHAIDVGLDGVRWWRGDYAFSCDGSEGVGEAEGDLDL
jgi:hypothetical protein